MSSITSAKKKKPLKAIKKSREPYTTIRLAIRKWEKKHKKDDIRYAVVINFSRRWFPILNMDDNLRKLKFCEGLIMDSNKIEKFGGLNSLKHLTYISMELNQIKNLKGLEPVKYSLQVLLLGCNLLQSLKGVEDFPYLETLHIPNNMISHWSEFDRLLLCERLTNICMRGNRFNANIPTSVWIFLASRRNPKLRIIENTYITDKFPKGYHPSIIIEPCPDKKEEVPSKIDLKISKKKLPKTYESSFNDANPSTEISIEAEISPEASGAQWIDYF